MVAVYRELIWTEESEDHIARHQVAPQEVDEVVNSRPIYTAGGREETTLVYGTTGAGRYLLAVLAEAGDGRWYVVTARDMTGVEARTYRKEGSMTMTRRVEELREYYDTTDTSELLEGATSEQPDTPVEPMVTYALRLPQPVLAKLREVADHRGVRVSGLMRAWLEERLGRESAGQDEVIAVDDLLALVAKRAKARPGGRAGTSSKANKSATKRGLAEATAPAK